MSVIKKVIIYYDDKIATLEGDEALKWGKHNEAVASLAFIHGMNPFDTDPVKWEIKTVKQ